MGMCTGPERDKLFAADINTLTLAKAVELAESVRCARAGAAAATPVSQQEQTVFKVQGQSACQAKQPIKEKCTVCGRSNHKSSECRFVNYTCRKCNTKGHLHKMCKVKRVAADEVSEEDDDGKSVFNIGSESGEPMMVNGLPLKFEIDSGSAVTVISEIMYKKNFSNYILLSPRKRLFTYTGGTIICIGIAQLPVTYKQMSHTLDVYVVRDGGPPLLGRDFISRFRLQLAHCHFVNSSNDAIDKLQKRFPDVFSDKLGTFNKYQVKLRLKDDAKPIFFKARPIAFALREKVDKEIDRLTNLGVLQRVDHSEYASPVVPVLKRNGSVRLCADYSVSINKQLVVEQYPLPTVQELFSKLHGGQQFSKLDLSMAYNQFVLDEESQMITCINTHRGLFKYTRMVFGLTSAPSIFQRAMENLLSGLDGVLCLLDDVLITADEPHLHLQRLTAVLQRLQDAGLTLQKEKCEFFKNEINYLGYVINKNGLKKSPEKVRAIKDSPVPTDIQKEATAIIFGVRRYHQYLYGRSDPFVLRTDHKPLISIFGPYKGIPEVSANRLQRYAMFLNAYNYNIEYVRSENNSADYLSRASLSTETEHISQSRTSHERGSSVHAAAAATPLDRATYVNFIIEANLPVTLEVLRRETNRDETLKKVIDFIMNGWPRKMSDYRIKPFHQCKTQLSYENGCVMRGHKVVLPESL